MSTGTLEPTFEQTIQNYARLRTVVGYLGETSDPKWWDTSFLNEVGKKFLLVNFPRSALAAGVNGAGIAAKRLHDERIGRAGTFHLFRLAYDLEQRVHDALLRSDQESLWSIIGDREGALSALAELAAGETEAPEGPVQVGTSLDMVSIRAVSEVAKRYRSAFLLKRLSLPYFSASAAAI